MYAHRSAIRLPGQVTVMIGKRPDYTHECNNTPMSLGRAFFQGARPKNDGGRRGTVLLWCYPRRFCNSSIRGLKMTGLPRRAVLVGGTACLVAAASRFQPARAGAPCTP